MVWLESSHLRNVAPGPYQKLFPLKITLSLLWSNNQLRVNTELSMRVFPPIINLQGSAWNQYKWPPGSFFSLLHSSSNVSPHDSSFRDVLNQTWFFSPSNTVVETFMVSCCPWPEVPRLSELLQLPYMSPADSSLVSSGFRASVASATVQPFGNRWMRDEQCAA